MKIYRNTIEIYDLSVDTKTVVKRRLMVENTISLSVTVDKSTPLDIRIGDYFDMGAERYMVLDEPTYSLRGEVYDYSILLRGNLHRLEVYLMPDDGIEEWWYYGRVIEQIDKVVAALNTKESGWSVVYPDVSELADNEAKNINYANMSILSALHAICSAENGWAMEFDIEGKVIHFARQIKTPTELRFEYGRGKGLYELTRGELSGEKVNTRLYAYGGTANMPNAHRLSMVDVNDGLDYVEKNKDQYGLRETRINFDHIYPRRNSTITRNAEIVEVGKANWTVVDSALDFDLQAQIVEEPVIIFTSGDCAGAEFVIVKYDHPTKTITFKESVDDSGAEPYILPNASRYPKSGDQYAFVNILMPDSYVAAAKAELKQAAVEEINQQAIPKRSYSVKCDPRYIGALATRPKAGDECRIIDTPNGVDYSARIIGYEYPIIEPNNISLTIADKVAIPSAVVLAKSVKEVKMKLSALDKGQLTESYLRKVFHPLGGRENLDMTTKELAAVERITTPEIMSPDFQSGIVRAGYKISTDPQTKRSTLEIGRVIADELIVDLLTHQKVQSIGGVLIVSQAWADIVRVENLGSAYRCFYIPDDGAQLWRAGDQALCKDAGKYYWRYVSSVSDQPSVEGEHWLNLSIATADGSGVPADGDEIVLLGHRGVDTTRQGATIISSGTLGYADPFVHYGGINSFSLAGKQLTVIGDNSRFVGSSFTIVAPDGSLNRIPRDCGGWATGRSEYYDRVSHKGSMWLCVASDGTTVEPSDAAEGVWLKQVEQGSKGDYLVQGYCWAEDKPQRPVGSSPEGWSAGSDRGVAIVDGSSANSSANNSASSSANDSTEAEAETNHLLTDESGALLLDPYPANYRLWGSTATFDGATGEVVGEWSDPYQVSAEDGKDGQDGNSTNLLSRLSANWRRGVNLGADGTYRDWDGYICPRKALEVKGGATYTLQRLSDNQLFSIVILLYDQSDAYLGAAAVRVAIQGNLVFQTPPAAKFARFNFGSNPEGGTHYVSLLAELATSQVGLYQGEVTQWSVAPAPEDVQVEIEQAKLDAERKSKQAKIDALKTLVDDSEALKDSAFVDDIAKFIQDDDAIFEIKKDKNGEYHVCMKSAFAERLVVIDAFVDKLTVKQLCTTKGQVEITDNKQKFGNMEIDQGKVVINGANGRRVELWNTNITEDNVISGGGTFPGTKSIAEMSAYSGEAGSTIVSRSSAYFNATVGLGFNCTISGEVLPSLKGVGRVSLYVVSSTGQKELITTISKIAGGVINEQIISTIPLGGSVKFLIEAEASNYYRKDYFTGEFTAHPSTVNVATTTFNFTSDINRLILAPNGYAVINASNDYVIMATGIKKIVSPYYDAPGVLAKAQVTSLNMIQKPWGAYKITAVSGISVGDANKRVNHTFPKESYTAIITPVGKNVVANVIKEYANYVEIYSTGAFNITLVGDNR